MCKYQLKEYDIGEISSAPHAPGVYVWFARLTLGEADLTCRESFWQVIAETTRVLKPQKLTVKASSYFSLAWSGPLDPNENEQIKVRSSLGERERRLVWSILKTAQPVFMQPLYVGMAEISLRNRLKSHVKEYYRLRDTIRMNEAAIYEGEDDFAQRAIKMGLLEDQLYCNTIEVHDHKNYTKDEIIRSVSLAESCLNNWSAPKLGRK